MKEFFAHFLEFTLTFDKVQNSSPLICTKFEILAKILPFLTARYIIVCTRQLHPLRDDCTVRVQWFSSVIIVNKRG